MAAVMAAADTVGDLTAIQEDLVEVDFVAEVLEDILPDFLVGAA